MHKELKKFQNEIKETHMIKHQEYSLKGVSGI